MGVQTVHRMYKYRIYPTVSQCVVLQDWLEKCREVYNAGLQERRDAWRLNRVKVTCFDQFNQMPELKKLRPDLCTVPAQVLREPLQRLDRAFVRFFTQVTKGYPRFKPIRQFNSVTFPSSQGFKVGDQSVIVSKIGKIRARIHRPLIGDVKTLTIKREGSRWFAVFGLHQDSRPLAPIYRDVGVDLGIRAFLTLSTGERIANDKYQERAAAKLRVARRRLNRRRCGSCRWHKALVQVQNLSRKVCNRRADFQHKLSTRLVREFDLIAVEDLNIKGMARSVLSRQVLDVSWGSFITKLIYKAESADRQVVKVPPRNTSQQCSGCGAYVHKELAVRVHKCTVCGIRLDRDHNAALNILRLGQGLQDVTYRVTESVS